MKKREGLTCPADLLFTDRFLRCFSLNSLDDLPDLPEEEKKDDSQTSLFEDDNDETSDIPEAEILEEGDEE